MGELRKGSRELTDRERELIGHILYTLVLLASDDSRATSELLNAADELQKLLERPGGRL